MWEGFLIYNLIVYPIVSLCLRVKRYGSLLFYIFISLVFLAIAVLIVSFYMQSVRIDETHYDVLNLPQNATKKMIKDAYREISRKLHPDRNPDSQDTYVRVQQAYAVLGSFDHETLENYKAFGDHDPSGKFNAHTWDGLLLILIYSLTFSIISALYASILNVSSNKTTNGYALKIYRTLLLFLVPFEMLVRYGGPEFAKLLWFIPFIANQVAFRQVQALRSAIPLLYHLVQIIETHSAQNHATDYFKVRSRNMISALYAENSMKTCRYLLDCLASTKREIEKEGEGVEGVKAEVAEAAFRVPVPQEGVRFRERSRAQEMTLGDIQAASEVVRRWEVDRQKRESATNYFGMLMPLFLMFGFPMLQKIFSEV